MNRQRFRIGDWVQTTLVPEAVRVLARSVHSDEYECGFMDERECSMPLGNREFRINNRPRVRAGPPHQNRRTGTNGESGI